VIYFVSLSAGWIRWNSIATLKLLAILGNVCSSKQRYCSRYYGVYVLLNRVCLEAVISMCILRGDSVARGPKLLCIKNYVIEIMTWKFIYTYRERWKTGPAHNQCWNWPPFTSKDTWMRFSKFWNTCPKVSTRWQLESLGVYRFWVARLCGVYFCTLCPSIGPKERSRQALSREIWVAKGFYFYIILSLIKL
jgi:hypothetical protein